jgi:hypothetical protein
MPLPEDVDVGELQMEMGGGHIVMLASALASMSHVMGGGYVPAWLSAVPESVGAALTKNVASDSSAIWESAIAPSAA